MAKAEDKPITPTLGSGEPRFPNRHTATTHQLRPRLYLLTTARQLTEDFVGLARGRANSRKLKKEDKAILKDSIERLKLALKTFEDLDEDRQHELLAILWAGFHMGRTSDRRLQRSQHDAEAAQKRAKAAREVNTERNNRAHELGLTLANKMRREHPTLSNMAIATRVVPQVIKQMSDLYPGADYSIEVPTFAKRFGAEK